MADFSLLCSSCVELLPPDHRGWACPRCGSPLAVAVDYEFDVSAVKRDVASMWRYESALPFSLDEAVTLGEGYTPVVKRRLYGLEVFLKLEYLNPSGSFKDRGACVAVTRAKRLGAELLHIDSSGNAGIATSAYGAAAGLSVRVYAPKDAPKGKLHAMMAFGAEIVLTDTRGLATGIATEAAESAGLYVGHSWNPFFLEGTKTFAFEVVEQLGWRAPDSVVIPTASGSLLLGAYKGFLELLASGVIEEAPKLIAVQAEGYTPLYDALSPKPWRGGVTKLADGLRVSDPPRLGEMIEAVKVTGGEVVVVTDEEIAKALAELVSMGFLVEPTSASALAALKKLAEAGKVGDPVVVPLTGSGLKVCSEVAELVRRYSSDARP